MKKPTHDTQKAVRDLFASREVIEGNIDLFHSGRRSSYRVIAVELRKLFCDGKNSLIPRLFSGVKLHPHNGYSPGMDTNFALQVVGHWSIRGREVELISVFEEGAVPIPLEEWLNQPFLSGQISLRDFIRSVSDKEGAHSDALYNTALGLANSVNTGPEKMLGRLVIGIGEYVLEVLDFLISQLPQNLRDGAA